MFSWKSSIHRWFSHRRGGKSVFLENVFDAPPESPRALLVYLAKPFIESDEWRNTQARHSNVVHSYRIGRLIADRGYAVDVAGYKSNEIPNNLPYDFMVGFGPLCRRLATTRLSTTKKIYIAAGIDTEINNKNQALRANQVEHRRGCRLSTVHFDLLPTEEMKAFDLVACFGNEFIADTYRRHGLRVMPFNNTPIRPFPCPDRDIIATRRSFMFYASGPPLRKGLDLVLESFSRRPDLRLFVCGRHELDRKFVRCYERELYHLPNIKSIGELIVGSPEFLEICSSCAFVILPSCAEGSVGSAVECMHAGLIPVLTSECGIDVNDYGVLIPSTTVDAVDQTLTALDGLSVSELERRGRATLDACQAHFSLAGFERRWREILTAAGA